MRTNQSGNKKTEVYSISGFKDTLASPVFYPVIVVAIVLGITSMFGFVQNPLKLKSMVNVIHEKVATTNVVSKSSDDQLYKVSNKIDSNADSIETQTFKSFDVFSEIDEKIEKMPIDKSIERIAFNYDLTSENFWSDLDSSQLETAAEEMERKQREANLIGAPLETNKLEKLPSKFKLGDESIYALNKEHQI